MISLSITQLFGNVKKKRETDNSDSRVSLFLKKQRRMGFQRDCVPLAESRGSASGSCSQLSENSEIIQRRFAKGEFQNSPVDCLGRGNALQVKAFPCKNKMLFCLRSYLRTKNVNEVNVVPRKCSQNIYNFSHTFQPSQTLSFMKTQTVLSFS